MSNPGVILLASTQVGQHQFHIEDNIGEAIHFHFDDVRLDLTVQEYLTFCQEMCHIINELVAVDGFDAASLDSVFLHQIAGMLPDLEEVRMDEIDLRDLLVDVRCRMGTFIKPLAQSRVVRALQGNDKENASHFQTNLIGQSNEDRVRMVRNILLHEQYGKNGQFIVLFNSQNIIRDGQHRAACMYHADGGMRRILVMRLCFKNEKYNLSMHPWLHEWGWMLRGLLSPRMMFHAFMKIKDWLVEKKVSMINEVRARIIAVRLRVKV